MTDFTAIWNAAKQIWKPVSEVGSVISSTGFVGYAIKEIRKKYQKPELACSLLTHESLTRIIQLGDTIPDGRGGFLLQPNGTSRMEQSCSFTIANNSDYIAFKLRLVNREIVDWDFPLESTFILKPYENKTIDVYPKSVMLDHNINSINSKHSLIDNIVIEYRNISGKKYQLIFLPNEVDFDKRNVISKA